MQTRLVYKCRKARQTNQLNDGVYSERESDLLRQKNIESALILESSALNLHPGSIYLFSSHINRINQSFPYKSIADKMCGN